MTNDGLTIYFYSTRPGNLGNGDIYTSSRISLESDWSPSEVFAPASTSSFDAAPFISNDGLTFLFNSQVEGPGVVIYGLSRDTIEDPWGPRFALPAPINDGVSHSRHASLSSDGLTLLFVSERDGADARSNIWEAVRPTLNDPWAARVLGPNVNTSFVELEPHMSSDGLMLLFSSRRVGGEGHNDIWMSKRNAIGDEWGPASNLGPTVNTAGSDKPSQLWEPGNLLLIGSNGLPGFGEGDMFYVSVVPEPSTLAVSFSGVLLLMGIAGRRRKRT